MTVFGKRAETLAKFLRKGMLVTVDGQNRTSSYEKEGQKHYSTEIVAYAVYSPDERGTRPATADDSADAPFAPPSALNGGYGRVPAATAAADIPF